MFNKLALIGIGLIGSSIARAARLKGLAKTIAISTRKEETLEEARALGLGDIYTLDAAEAVRGADLVILCIPVGAYLPVMEAIRDALEPGAILSDVGSVKGQVMALLGAAGAERGAFHPRPSDRRHRAFRTGFGLPGALHWSLVRADPGAGH